MRLELPGTGSAQRLPSDSTRVDISCPICGPGSLRAASSSLRFASAFRLALISARARFSHTPESAGQAAASLRHQWVAFWLSPCARRRSPVNDIITQRHHGGVRGLSNNSPRRLHGVDVEKTVGGDEAEQTDSAPDSAVSRHVKAESLIGTVGTAPERAGRHSRPAVDPETW